MEHFYIIILALLVILAISDLMVGVGNDAVNFLNSAIGSKAAPLPVIMAVAIAGILVGTLFSSGMMEIARSGLFDPGQFHFNEVMIIFLAVMITDVLLLNTFNSLGLPTSTTVSIVFELLGASVGVAILKIMASDVPFQELARYINTGKALAIITGILFSVIVAFTFGSLLQYVSRLLFSFNFKPRMKYLGGLWAGFSITAITYFMIIKGAKGASFIPNGTVEFIESHSISILLISILGWSAFFQLLIWLFRVDVLKIVVLIGTFALAMAFAGNDLVNFIGVPMAGWESFKIYQSIPEAGNGNLLMEGLKAPIQTNSWLLILSGVVMALTLIFSRKAKKVIKTSLNLSRQEEGDERFSSTALSRSIVRLSVNIGKNMDAIMPEKLRQFLARQFEVHAEIKQNTKPQVSFDMVRASVNLVVASALIAFGTSMKLPLSTTYVTFMVAMGSSFADGAWGRESAVYRVTGVVSVIGGWFVTAFVAFTATMIISMIMFSGGEIAVYLLSAITVFVLVREHRSFKKKDQEEVKVAEADSTLTELTGQELFEKGTLNIISHLKTTNTLYVRTLNALFAEDRKKIKEVHDEIVQLDRHTKMLKNNIHKTLGRISEDSMESGQYYVQVIDYLREISHCLNYISEPCVEHIENNHKGLIAAQKTELNKLIASISAMIKLIREMIENKDFGQQAEAIKLQTGILESIEKMRKAQVKRIKAKESGTRNSVLFLNILSESKNLTLFTVNLYKSQRDFIIAAEKQDQLFNA